MHLVQALHWLRDMMTSDEDSIQNRLKAILNDPIHRLFLGAARRLGTSEENICICRGIGKATLEGLHPSRLYQTRSG